MKTQLAGPPQGSQPSLTSSAFPANKFVPESSVFHQIIKQSEQLSASQEQEMFKNVSMRLTNKQQDILEIWDLQMEWFPLKYGAYFYERIIEGKYRCLVAEVDVVIEWDKLIGILKVKYEKQKAKYLEAINKGHESNAFNEPSKYFENQGIKTTYLENPGTSPFEMKDNPKLKPVIKIKVMVGIMVFDLTMSNGYLSGVWWKQNVFGGVNSIYINTIGVIAEYRKHGVARKMIEWLADKTKKDNLFKLIYLHVIQYNTAAIKLYEKLGFRHLDTFKEHYNVDDKAYTGLLLGLFVNGGQQQQSWGQWWKKLWK